jgi:hypothetical protein
MIPTIGVWSTSSLPAFEWSEDNVPATQQTREIYVKGEAWLFSNSELVVNGDFATDTVWTKNTGWTISGGKAHHASGSGTGTINQTVATIGQCYDVTYTISNMTAGTLTISGPATGIARTANGTYTDRVIATATGIAFTPSLYFNGSIDDVSVKLTIAPIAAELIFSADYPNTGFTRAIVDATEVITDNATWTKLTVTYTPSQTGIVKYSLNLIKYGLNCKIYVDTLFRRPGYQAKKAAWKDAELMLDIDYNDWDNPESL